MATLNMDFIKTQETSISRPQCDYDIYDYISFNQDNDFKLILEKDNRWEVFYHLSKMRESLLNWYPFGKDAQVLEVGGEFGALTGTLCKRCKRVVSIERYSLRAEGIFKRYKTCSNLEVIAGEFIDIKFIEKFDFVIIIGKLEYQSGSKFTSEIYENYLKKAKSLLKENGRLLLAIENRFGIKYFCGCIDPFSGVPFAGINNYPLAASGRSFTKDEIKNILDKVGFGTIKFYYPIPDYKLPQLIFTDEYMPKSSIKERVIPYYINSNSLLAFENDLYDDLVANGMFATMCNSFLIECSVNEVLSNIIFAALSTDREDANAFITTIHSEGLVRKYPVNKEGVAVLERSYKNILELKNRGINVVLHKWNGSYIEMPYISSITLSDYIGKEAGLDKNKFIKVLDKLYNCILRSSEKSSHLNRVFPQNDDLDWGIILKKAFIDMVPMNCFYDNDELVFFDQEFMREDFPAKYIMFRAIKYAYLFFPYIEDVISKKDLAVKYGLLQLWEYFDTEENSFVFHNRQQKLYKNFLNWSTINREKINRNAKALIGE